MKEIINSYWGLLLFVLSCVVMYITKDIHPLFNLLLIPFWLVFALENEELE